MERQGVPWAKFQDVLRRRFAEKITRKSQRVAREHQQNWRPVWLFVVEAQKNGRPHLHFVFRARWHRGSQWLLSRAELDRLIQYALRSVLGADINVQAAGNVQQVKRGMGEYLSKYLRKGRGPSQADLIRARGHGEILVPTAWWGCCSESRKMLERYVFPLPDLLANLLSRERGRLTAKGFMVGEVFELQGDGAPSVLIGSWRGVKGLIAAVRDLMEDCRDRLGLACELPAVVA